jgi:hypothetical protein
MAIGLVGALPDRPQLPDGLASGNISFRETVIWQLR